MKVLVTGGAGYIGSVTSHLLIERGHQVVILDDLSTGHLDAIPEGAEFIEGSILDPEAITRALSEVVAVVHFAGKSLVGESMEKPELYWSVNRDGSAALIEGMKRANVKRMVFSSSAATYGEPTRTPIEESDPTVPTNVYGETKLAVEKLLSAEKVFSSISLRYFNVAGALVTDNDLVIGERHHPETHLLPNVVNAVRGPEPVKLTLHGDDWPTPDGSGVRDYVHVVDLADAHIKALNLLSGHGDISISGHVAVNLGSGVGYSVREVITAAEEVLGAKASVLVGPRRAGDPAVLVAGIARAGQLLGWRPTRGLHEMVESAARL
ncbi:MAG: UDP-glucose 4-epimerase GalE [Actinobacteria bacterium]|jgi:UDP-glucose 4-epimerase|nr:UDP-glucose 4-epimerase GalE [Actinomycetota bacterium]